MGSRIKTNFYSIIYKETDVLKYPKIFLPLSLAKPCSILKITFTMKLTLLAISICYGKGSF